MIVNTPFSQATPTALSPRNSPSLSGEVAALNTAMGAAYGSLIDGWVSEGATLNYLSANSFSTTGNTTSYYTVGRQLRINRSTSPVYVTVLSSSYNGAITTITTQQTTVPNPVNTVDLSLQPMGSTNPTLYSPTLQTPTVNGPTVRSPLLTIISDPDAATITMDLSPTTGGQYHVVGPLTATRTLALSGVQTGQVFMVEIVNNSSGGNGVNWWSGIKWTNQVVPTLSSGANAIDVFGFVCTGTGAYQGFTVGLNQG